MLCRFKHQPAEIELGLNQAEIVSLEHSSHGLVFFNLDLFWAQTNMRPEKLGFEKFGIRKNWVGKILGLYTILGLTSMVD